VARARNIKPSFFHNETLVELPFEHRLLFVGLWTLADREGRLEDRPKKIKMEIFPADNVDVESGLSLLEKNGFIHRYITGDVRIIQVIAFVKHQSPHHTEKKSVLPSFNGEVPVNPPKPDGGNPPDSLNPDSLNHESGVAPKGARGKPLTTLTTYIENQTKAKAKLIPENHAVLTYAKSAGIPQDFLALAWHEFKSRYTTSPDDHKKYRDWPGVFLKAVKGNWFKVWVIDSGAYKLTTIGQQAEMARKAHVQH